MKTAAVQNDGIFVYGHVSCRRFYAERDAMAALVLVAREIAFYRRENGLENPDYVENHVSRFPIHDPAPSNGPSLRVSCGQPRRPLFPQSVLSSVSRIRIHVHVHVRVRLNRPAARKTNSTGHDAR